MSDTQTETDEHPYITKAKEIVQAYVSWLYTLAPDAKNVDVEFELVSSLWTWGRWTVDLKCNLDGATYTVLHNGTTGAVTGIDWPEDIEEQ